MDDAQRSTAPEQQALVHRAKSEIQNSARRSPEKFEILKGIERHELQTYLRHSTKRETYKQLSGEGAK